MERTINQIMMKYRLGVLILLIGISCSREQRGEKPYTEDLHVTNNFDWLIGKWKRTNDKEGNTSYEEWTKNSRGEYIGFGCRIYQGDTIFKEHLRLVKLNGNWNYEVTGVNENPTLFLLTNQTISSFDCENKLNEFPKVIEYAVSYNILVVRISDGERAVPFYFRKMLVEHLVLQAE